MVLLSSDTPELVHLCDRVAVLREGRVVVTLDAQTLSEEAIVAAAMGWPAKRSGRRMSGKCRERLQLHARIFWRRNSGLARPLRCCSLCSACT